MGETDGELPPSWRGMWRDLLGDAGLAAIVERLEMTSSASVEELIAALERYMERAGST